MEQRPNTEADLPKREPFQQLPVTSTDADFTPLPNLDTQAVPGRSTADRARRLRHTLGLHDEQFEQRIAQVGAQIDERFTLLETEIDQDFRTATSSAQSDLTHLFGTRAAQGSFRNPRPAREDQTPTAEASEPLATPVATSLVQPIAPERADIAQAEPVSEVATLEVGAELKPVVVSAESLARRAEIDSLEERDRRLAAQITGLGTIVTRLQAINPDEAQRASRAIDEVEATRKAVALRLIDLSAAEIQEQDSSREIELFVETYDPATVDRAALADQRVALSTAYNNEPDGPKRGALGRQLAKLIAFEAQGLKFLAGANHMADSQHGAHNVGGRNLKPQAYDEQTLALERIALGLRNPDLGGPTAENRGDYIDGEVVRETTFAAFGNSLASIGQEFARQQREGPDPDAREAIF